VSFASHILHTQQGIRGLRHAKPPYRNGGSRLSDGRLQVEDDIFDTPSGAARAVASRSANGWSFWLTAAGGDENLRDLRNEYAGKFGDDAVADDDQDADEEEL